MAARTKRDRDAEDDRLRSSCPTKHERVDEEYIANRTVSRLMAAKPPASFPSSSSASSSAFSPSPLLCSTCEKLCERSSTELCQFCEKVVCQSCVVFCSSCYGNFCQLCSVASWTEGRAQCFDCREGRAPHSGSKDPSTFSSSSSSSSAPFQSSSSAAAALSSFQPLLDDDEVRQLSTKQRQPTLDHFWTRKS